MDAVTLEKIFSQFGLPVGLLLTFLFASYRTARFFAEKLFDKDNGVVQLMVSKHLSFLSEVSQSLRLTSEVQQEIVRDIASLRADVSGLRGQEFVAVDRRLASIEERLDVLADVDTEATTIDPRRVKSRTKEKP